MVINSNFPGKSLRPLYNYNLTPQSTHTTKNINADADAHADAFMNYHTVYPITAKGRGRPDLALFFRS